MIPGSRACSGNMLILKDGICSFCEQVLKDPRGVCARTPPQSYVNEIDLLQFQTRIWDLRNGFLFSPGLLPDVAGGWGSTPGGSPADVAQETVVVTGQDGKLLHQLLLSLGRELDTSKQACRLSVSNEHRGICAGKTRWLSLLFPQV